jgi:hypothetical protein
MLFCSPASAAIGSAGAIPALYKNCTNLNKKYPHGLGSVGARDHTSGTPVDELQAEYEALQARDVLQPRTRPRQGRYRLRKGVNHTAHGCIAH